MHGDSWGVSQLPFHAASDRGGAFGDVERERKKRGVGGLFDARGAAGLRQRLE